MNFRDVVVFRTSNREVIDSFRAAVNEYDEWRQRITDFARSVHPKADPMTTSAWGEKRFAGLSIVIPTPPGWRVIKSKSIMVPHKAIAAGKELAATVAELETAPHVRASLPGMPSGAMSGLSYMSPGIEQVGEDLFVTWSLDPDEADTSRTVGKVDKDIWERVPLSTYYLIVEQNETEARASVGA